MEKEVKTARLDFNNAQHGLVSHAILDILKFLNLKFAIDTTELETPN